MTLEDSEHADVVDNVAVGIKGSFNKMLLTSVSSATAVLQKIRMFRSKDMFNVYAHSIFAAAVVVHAVLLK